MTDNPATPAREETLHHIEEVLIRQERLGHAMTVMPTDALRLLFDAASVPPRPDEPDLRAKGWAFAQSTSDAQRDYIPVAEPEDDENLVEPPEETVDVADMADADKLRILAMWFDNFDDWREATGKVAPGITDYREVQMDLRRIADSLVPVPPRPDDALREDEEDTVIEARRALRDGNAFDIRRLLDIIERLAATPAAAVRPVYCDIHQHHKWCEHNGGVMGATGWEAPAAAVREAGLDVRRVVQAITSIALRHGLAKDPPAIAPTLMSVYGYSRSTPDMDAEVAAEYARLATTTAGTGAEGTRWVTSPPSTPVSRNSHE